MFIEYPSVTVPPGHFRTKKIYPAALPGAFLLRAMMRAICIWAAQPKQSYSSNPRLAKPNFSSVVPWSRRPVVRVLASAGGIRPEKGRFGEKAVLFASNPGFFAVFDMADGIFRARKRIFRVGNWAFRVGNWTFRAGN